MSVQEALETAFEGLCGEAVTVHGSGRTDTGVHALRQVASVHLDTRLDDDRLRPRVERAPRRGRRRPPPRDVSRRLPPALRRGRQALPLPHRDDALPAALRPRLRALGQPAARRGRDARGRERLGGGARLPRVLLDRLGPQVDRAQVARRATRPPPRALRRRRGGERLPLQHGAHHRGHLDRRPDAGAWNRLASRARSPRGSGTSSVRPRRRTASTCSACATPSPASAAPTAARAERRGCSADGRGLLGTATDTLGGPAEEVCGLTLTEPVRRSNLELDPDGPNVRNVPKLDRPRGHGGWPSERRSRDARTAAGSPCTAGRSTPGIAATDGRRDALSWKRSACTESSPPAPLR